MQRGEREDGLNDVPVVDMTTERRRRRSRWTWIGSAGIVVVALAVAIPIVATRNSGHDAKTGGGRHPRRPDRRTAIVDVRASIAFTGSARSYDFRGTFTPDGAGSQMPAGITVTTTGTIDVDPFAMVAHASLGGSTPITTYQDANTVWEQGGAMYGATSGLPLSGFASSVLGTLGVRQGAVAMMSLASPGGYLNLAADAVTAATKIGTGEVDGTPVTRYRVTLDAAQLLDRPGMSDDELAAGRTALEQLRQNGYTTTVVVISIDGQGLVRESQPTVEFSDGGAVQTDTIFSNFGCTPRVVLPGHTEPSSAPSSPDCLAPPTSSTTNP